MNRTPTYRGRFAPSPTGELHLGSAACALVAWLRARQAGGRLILRVEDLDTPRIRAGCEAAQLDDLAWLGLDWDEGSDLGGAFGPYRQSERLGLYEAALRELERRGLTYPCDCSRAEIARAASAPHAGEEGPPYPGLCRDASRHRAFKRPTSTRVRVPPGQVAFEDAFQGTVVQDVSADVGDFVLRRGDGVFAYQLAVVVDDIAMGVTEVVRGADLIASTPRQILLARLLGQKAPSFGHVPLLVGPDGQRLAKRDAGIALADLRRAGVRPERVIGALGALLGLRRQGDGEVPMTALELLEEAELGSLSGRREVVVRPGLGLLP